VDRLVDRPLDRPLRGLRVLDVGTRIAAPFCAGLLGELGAEVIKVEDPRDGDFMRTIGPFRDGYSLFWAVEGRGRRSVTCDLRVPAGQALFRRLAARADVVCENFRPGTMEGWHIGPADCDAGLVWVRISVFGQDGPYAARPGLDRQGIGYGGLLHLTGYPDAPPVRPGVTVSDYLTGVFGALHAVAQLYARRPPGVAGTTGAAGPADPAVTARTADTAGTGGTAPDAADMTGAAGSADRLGVGPAVIDAPLYGAILRILEWTVAGYDQLGLVRDRTGNRVPGSAPLDNFLTADGKYVCIVAGSDANFARLCAAMDRPDLASDPAWATLARRAERADEITGVVAAWARKLTAAEIERVCIAHDVPVGTAYTAADIASDPHMSGRGDLVTVDDPVLGPVRQQAPFPRLVGTRPDAPAGAPRLGQHNDEVWRDLVGLTPDELADHRARGVI
jgi:crotonobetainyl-CoA:carnitine CoA-transferase CaiB-like acyl-CoA transferase